MMNYDPKLTDQTKQLTDAAAGGAQFMMRFWAGHIRAYAGLLEGAAACKSPTDLMAVQSRYVQDVQKAFAQDSGAISKLFSYPTHKG